MNRKKTKTSINTPDWHRAQIQCALRMKGYSLAQLSREYGLSSGTLANALSKPWLKGELIIAMKIGIPPEKIWPSRYYDDEKPVKRILRKVY